MVLEVVEVFDLTNDDRDFSVGIDLIDRRLVGTAFSSTDTPRTSECTPESLRSEIAFF
jgi:hypothetical protein